MKSFTKSENFIFEMIHDLKAPVLSIDFALKNVVRNDFLEEIYKINRHNLNYIESMLSEYSLARGKLSIKLEVIDIYSIIKEEVQILNFFIKEKNLRILISTDKAGEHTMVSDKCLIRQIILNLLTNAIKYTKANGIIKIVFEKKNNYISICFVNGYEKLNSGSCSTKMGLEIIKKKLQTLKGSLKIVKSNGEICFNLIFKTA